MRHFAFLIFLLIGFWLLNSGHYSNLMLFLGLSSILVVLYLSYRMNIIDNESQPFALVFKFTAYSIWLFKQIIDSNITVVKCIWLGNSSISPSFKKIPVSQQTDLGKVIYANSITVTPGTVTVDIDKQQFLVHALCRDSITELESGDMDKRVTQLEEK